MESYNYQDSKALGRELTEDETLDSALVPEEDRLILTADITAGGFMQAYLATVKAGTPFIRYLCGAIGVGF